MRQRNGFWELMSFSPDCDLKKGMVLFLAFQSVPKLLKYLTRLICFVLLAGRLGYFNIQT